MSRPDHQGRRRSSSERSPERLALAAAFGRETRLARDARRSGNTVEEWRHLERAHVLSQPAPWLHVRTHLRMLWYAVRCRDGREAAGQALRALVAGPASAFGRYPIGNTGGARVPATKPMPIPADLRAVLAPFAPPEP